MRRSLARISAMLMSAALAGCGGGGDGGGGGGSAGPLTYSGNTNSAVITTANAARLTANVMGGGDASTSLSSLSGGTTGQEPGNGLVDVGRRLGRGLRATPAGRAGSAQRATSAINIDETVPCDSGSVRTVGTVNDNGTGTLSVSYNDCRLGDDTFSGAATMRVDAFDLLVEFATDYTLSFARLTLRGPGDSIDLSGSLRLQRNIAAHTETFTENIVSLNNFTGRMTKSENLVFVDVYSNIFSPSSYVESINGRVFESVDGFVDITTVVPFVFGIVTQLLPDSGQILLTGAGNARIRSTVLSTSRLTLALDLNGDNIFETVATLSWTDLSGQAGGDLADDDGDGMHNSWEVVNGLNRSDPGDAALDSDSDGASNLNEYLAGTDPRNASSRPPAVGLSIAASDSPDPATVGGSVTYTLTVANSSAVAANSVEVVDTLPVGVNLVSVTTTQGSCTVLGSIVCNLGTINGFGSAVVTVVVTPTAEGVFNNTATVTTSSFDPTTSDNAATSTTTAGQPVAGIQGLIDAAAPGDTVVVGPGTYFGGLNFNGKNIVLRSSAGPATTIIHGNQGTAVRMGPGGTISGFTITGASAYFGAGIEVSGQGSLISGNIFDGNLQFSGGFGAGIGGNGASPTIERNVFRNNSCDDQYPAGVVAFVNNSSPRIVNNVFENNQCRAINFTLPQSNTPRIVNNTFVGNRTAIRVDRRVPQGTQVYRNNIIVQNGIGLEIEFGSDADNPVWANNLVFGNTVDYQGTASQTGGNANISANPLFINQAAGNYRLQPASPAIDAGAVLDAPAADFDGTPRPLDGNGDATAIVDIGAFEAP